MANQVAVTARGFASYQDQFGITEAEVGQLSFLDCAAGASCFGVQARMRGGTALAVDPLYADPDLLLERVQRNLQGAPSWLDERRSIVNWGSLGSVDAYTSDMETNLELFLGDLASKPEHYAPGSLPVLPLGDDSYDVALCSNFLFAYDDVLSFDFHFKSIAEMVRVAKKEARIHPIISRAGRSVDFLQDLRSALAAEGIETSERSVPASWLREAHSTLVCHA